MLEVNRSAIKPFYCCIINISYSAIQIEGFKELAEEAGGTDIERMHISVTSNWNKAA